MADDFLDAQGAAEDAAESNAAAVAPALDGARKQFATAGRLDLTPSEKSRLSRLQTSNRRAGL